MSENNLKIAKHNLFVDFTRIVSRNRWSTELFRCPQKSYTFYISVALSRRGNTKARPPLHSEITKQKHQKSAFRFIILLISLEFATDWLDMFIIQSSFKNANDGTRHIGRHISSKFPNLIYKEKQ